MLVRKHDVHHHDGVRLLLAHGADPNFMTGWGITPLQQAVRRDNAAVIVEALLAHGADPRVPVAPPMPVPPGRSPDTALALAAWRGRADLLALFEAAGTTIGDDDPRALVAACARGDAERVRSLAAAHPDQASELTANAGEVLCLFAGNDNVAGIRCLAGLGLPVAAVWPGGDGYFEVPRTSMPLHVAAWRAKHGAVRALVDLGARLDVTDGAGRTPLALAVRACVASHWQAGRNPDSIATLLDAGADTARITLPTGYDEADRLIAARRR
jgi:ankyrin repeat protein